MSGVVGDVADVELVESGRGPAPAHAVGDVADWASEPIGALTITTPGVGIEN